MYAYPYSYPLPRGGAARQSKGSAIGRFDIVGVNNVLTNFRVQQCQRHVLVLVQSQVQGQGQRQGQGQFIPPSNYRMFRLSNLRQTYQVSRTSRETPAFWTPSPAHPPHRQNLSHFINKASFHSIQLQKQHIECTETRLFELKFEKFLRRGYSSLPRPYPQWGGDIGASLSASSASRSDHQSSSPASLFLNLGSPVA